MPDMLNQEQERILGLPYTEWTDPSGEFYRYSYGFYNETQLEGLRQQTAEGAKTPFKEPGIPPPESEITRMARKKSLKKQAKRKGRQSTILTAMTP